MRNICSVADVIMPNYTEAAFLADKYIDKDDVTRAQAEELVDSLRKDGIKVHCDHQHFRGRADMCVWL